MNINSTAATTTLGDIAAILQAVAWPVVVLSLFLVYRSKAIRILDLLILKLKDAKRVKAGSLEIETEQAIGEVVGRTGEQATVKENERAVPSDQVEAAQLVRDKLDAAPIPFSHKIDVVYRQTYDLVEQYEAIRRDLSAGPQRTRTMNEIAAKMRALAIAARPILPSMMEGKRPGERLAAICILQVRPDVGYFYWLIDRVMQEQHAFILFQASLAISELVKAHPFLNPEFAAKAIQAALDHVANFRGGVPDHNTIDVLQDALSMLQNRATLEVR